MSLFEADRATRREKVARYSARSRALHLFILSGVGLFVELVLIRWLGAQVRPLAHVKNLVLIGCFLGLGLGFALAKRRRSTYPLAVITGHNRVNFTSRVLSQQSLHMGLGLRYLVGPTGRERSQNSDA